MEKPSGSLTAVTIVVGLAVILAVAYFETDFSNEDNNLAKHRPPHEVIEDGNNDRESHSAADVQHSNATGIKWKLTRTCQFKI